MDKERAYLESGAHRSMRKPLSKEKFDEISREIQNPALALDMRAALRLKRFLENEEITKRESENIYCWRHLPSFPDIYAPGEKERLQAGFYVHEQGRVCNLSSDWEGVLRSGLLPRKTGDPARDMTIDSVIEYADRYQDSELSNAVRNGAESFLGALKLLRVLHFALWASNVYHNTLGRFDQYMYPYYISGMEKGEITYETALEYVEELFLSFNRDSDLYTGMQQGDNGQSLMLGGVTREGQCAVNELTHICLKASLNNRRIDPKINLRVSKDTPLELFTEATQLTRQGLGFPQYANDDVIIDALKDMGYDLEDARDYTVAACWEFIIPGKGMDIPNIMAVSLALETHKAIMKALPSSESFDELLESVKEEIASSAREGATKISPLWMEPAPYQSVLMTDYTRDISKGAKYMNYGVHGTGFSEAVDQLAAIKNSYLTKNASQRKIFIQRSLRILNPRRIL